MTMLSESDALLVRRTGKRKLAKKIAMDTGQLRPGDELGAAMPTGVQSDCVSRTDSGVKRRSLTSNINATRLASRIHRGTGSAVRTRAKGWPVVRKLAVQLMTAVTVFGVLVTLLTGVAAQGRNAPIITIPQGSLLGVSTRWGGTGTSGIAVAGRCRKGYDAYHTAAVLLVALGLFGVAV